VLTSDQIGDFAEKTVRMEFARPLRDVRVLFRTVHLGEKYPVSDFLVEIVGPDAGSQGFFFVQVKGTGRASPPPTRIPVTVSAEEFNRLVAVPAPTYVIGVDVKSGDSYIVAAHRRRQARVSSITRGFPLRSDAVKLALYEEVADFWSANGRTLWQTRFGDV
jgi:hypothetical protein